MTSPAERGIWRYGALWVFAAALLVALPFQGTRSIWETSEGRYAECAREMQTTGNYLIPMLWGDPHLTKPPMTYWAIASGMGLLGRNAWGARLYGAFAYAFSTACVYELGRRLWRRRTGCIAAAVFATMPLCFFAANVVTTDILLCAWETGAVLCFVAAWRAGRPQAARRWVLAAWVLLGLGFLTKGPPALLPLAGLVVWRRRSAPDLPLFTVPALLIFALIGMGWFAGILTSGEATAADLIRREVIGRVASSAGHNRGWDKAISVYAPPLTAGLGVWLAVVVAAVIRERLWRRQTWAHWLARPTARLLLCWFVIPLAVFACSRSRLTLYVLPLAVPLALGLAAWMELRGRPSRRVLLGMVGGSLALLLASKAVIAYRPHDHDMRAMADVCLRAGGADARYILVNRSRMNGLRFYLDGNLTRLSFGRTVARAEGRLRTFLDELAARRGNDASGRPVVLVVNSGDRRTVADALVVRGLKIKAQDSWNDWEVWALDAATGDSRVDDGR